jgi:ribose/xylose/arabinose/galactoside ABC-type transport system permease subunit
VAHETQEGDDLKALDFRRNPVLATLLVCALLYVVCAIEFKGFASLRVALDLIGDNAYLGVIAVGMTFVILTGGIDLSVGALAGLSGILLAHLIERTNWNPVAASAAILAMGAIIGTFQGYLVSRFKLAPFLVTLSGLFLCRGLALFVSKDAISISSPTFKTWTDFSIPLSANAKLPTVTILFVTVLVVGIYAAKQTRFGRTIYAIGGNSPAAHLMGLSVNKTLISVYAISGLCASLGGLLFSIALGSGNPISGVGMELDVVAAVVIGGTLLNGGYGSVFGTFLGVIILGMIQTAINFQGTLNSWWTKIFIGVLLLAFILIQKALERSGSLASRT